MLDLKIQIQIMKAYDLKAIFNKNMLIADGACMPCFFLSL